MSCINWEGSKDKHGYGVRRINNKLVKAHRVALASSQGIDIPDGSIKCLHSCDNPSCVNPDHLRWGSQRDNIEDAVARHRMRSKLTEQQYKAIKEDDRLGRVVASEYGVAESYVSRIRNGLR